MHEEASGVAAVKRGQLYERHERSRDAVRVSEDPRCG
jgi:hypothetical protein